MGFGPATDVTDNIHCGPLFRYMCIVLEFTKCNTHMHNECEKLQR